MRSFTAGMIALLILLAGLTIYAAKLASDDCQRKGGTMRTYSTVAVGISSGGNIVTTPITINHCISADGKVLN